MANFVKFVICWKGGLKEMKHAEMGVLGNCWESVKRGSYGPHVKVTTPGVKRGHESAYIDHVWKISEYHDDIT